MTTTQRVNLEKKKETQVKFIELSGTKESTFLNCKTRGRVNICLDTKHPYCRLLSKHSKAAQQPVLFEMNNFEKKDSKKLSKLTTEVDMIRVESMEWDIQASLQILKIALLERTVDVFNLNYTSVRKTKDFTIKYQISDTMHQKLSKHTLTW